MLLQANEAAEKMLGIPLMNRVGERIEEIFPGVLESEFPKQYRDVIRTGVPFNDENRQYQDNVIAGAFESVTFRSAHQVVTVVFSEITERIRQTDELEKARANLERSQFIMEEALKLSHTGTWEWEVAADRFHLSQEWQDIHGVKTDVVSGEDLMPLAHPDDRAVIERRLEAAVRDDTPYDLEHRIVRRDSEEVRWVRTRAVVLRGEQGEAERMIGFSQDITEEHAWHQRLREKNEELTKFAHVVSHDLRAPLRAIRAAIGWLREDLGKVTPEAEESLALIEGRAGRLDGMIQGVLHYSRLPQVPAKNSQISLVPLLSETLKDLGIAEGSVELPMDDIELVADPLKLGQVLRNLIDNALRFASGRKAEKPMIAVRCEQKGTGWRLSVHDDGKGIDLEDRDRVFDLFATLQPRDEYESTGAGLAICKGLVERWGGNIGIEDSPLGGAEFWFTLPSQTQ